MTKKIFRKRSKLARVERPDEVVRRPSDILENNSRRDLGPELPVSIDRHSHTSDTFEVDTLQLEIVTLMWQTQIPPELIYAYMRTGLVVTDENYESLSPADKRAWDGAIAEYVQRFEHS